MKKDIKFPKVENVFLAVSKESEEDGMWNVHIINRSDKDLDNAMIVSKGYGEIDGEKKQTSVLRHIIEHVPPKTAKIIEPLDPKLLTMFNEYWVSFYIDKTIYDKKFVFVPGSVVEDNLVDIPELSAKGVLHK